MDILVVGGGIGGLTLALHLKASGLSCRIHVSEAVSEFKPLGVGINMLPHAMRELSQLGLATAEQTDAILALHSPEIRNHNKILVGGHRAVFELARA